MIELTDEIILKIEDLLNKWSLPALELGITAHNKEDIPVRYAEDPIFVEYYNGIKYGKTADEMREICLPKYIRRELKQLKIIE